MIGACLSAPLNQPQHLLGQLHLDRKATGKDRSTLLMEHGYLALVYAEGIRVRGFSLALLGEGLIVADAPDVGLELQHWLLPHQDHILLPAGNLAHEHLIKCRHHMEPEGVEMLHGSARPLRTEMVYAWPWRAVGGSEVAGHGAEGVHAGAAVAEEVLREVTRTPPSLVAGSDETVVVPIKTVVDPRKTVVVPIKTVVVEGDLVVEPGGTTVLPRGMVAALRAMVTATRKMVVQLTKAVDTLAKSTVLVARCSVTLALNYFTPNDLTCTWGAECYPRPWRTYLIRGPPRARSLLRNDVALSGPLCMGRGTASTADRGQRSMSA